MENMEFLKELLDGVTDEIIEDLKKIRENGASIHLERKGKKISANIEGHPALLMILLEDGVACVIKEIADGSYGGDSKLLFEMFVEGVRKSLNL